MNFFFS